MIRILDDAQAMDRAAAETIAGHIVSVVRDSGECRMTLSGGRTPQQTYTLLAQSPFKTRIPWSDLKIFWGDERCVPSGDKRHNATNAHKLLLDHVAVAPERVHPIDCANSPAAAAQAYEKLLQKELTGTSPVLDLTFLGLGEDGHTASLFPQTPILQEEHRWTADTYHEEEKMHRISMTPLLLNQSRLILFLVSGDAKAETLRRVLQGPYDPLNLPSQLIHPKEGECLWLVDRAAAGRLTDDDDKTGDVYGQR